MPLVSVRNLAGAGVITDVDAYDLPPNSLSMATNARCSDAAIERGPVARSAGQSLPRDPVHAFGFDAASGSTAVHVVDEQGYARSWSTSSQADISPASGWTASVNDSSVTSTILQDVVYINREDRTPWYRGKVAAGSYSILSSYAPTPGQAFPSNVRFKSLRATAGMLVGVGVTEGGTLYPNQVWWSDLAKAQGLPPSNWDVANGSYGGASISGRNTLAEMQGSLVDGWKLGNDLVLYGTKETYKMEFVGGGNVFNFRRLFGAGVLNTNCIVERDGVHYVFGTDDIYKHDGNTTRISIAQGRVRNYIYRNLVQTEVKRSFVVHDTALGQIMFCYTSSDRYCAFPYKPGGTLKGCNRAAVYNYVNDTWSMYDLPWVGSYAYGQVVSGLTYNLSTGLTYDNIGGSYAAQGSVVPNALLLASRAFTSPIDGSAQAAALRSYGLPNASETAATYDKFANAPMSFEKIRIDFDDPEPYGLRSPLTGYKYLSWVDVQGIIPVDAVPVEVSIGSSDDPSSEPVWVTSQTFSRSSPRIYCYVAGRYLAFRFKYTDSKPLRIGNLQLNVDVRSAY